MLPKSGSKASDATSLRVMPIKKFRDVSEMQEAAYEPGSQQLYEVIRYVWGLSDRICPLKFPAGVFKYRSIEDAEALRETWEDANFRARREQIDRARNR
jgi:hypothetical protein